MMREISRSPQSTGRSPGMRAISAATSSLALRSSPAISTSSSIAMVGIRQRGGADGVQRRHDGHAAGRHLDRLRGRRSLPHAERARRAAADRGRRAAPSRPPGSSAAGASCAGCARFSACARNGTASTTVFARLRGLLVLQALDARVRGAALLRALDDARGDLLRARRRRGSRSRSAPRRSPSARRARIRARRSRR